MPRPEQKLFFHRGQITLEMLMVGALALSLLAIAALSVSKMQKAENTAYERAALSGALNELADSSDEICVLGAGNSRAVPLPRVKLELGAGEGGRILEISGGGFRMARKTICQNEIILDGPFGSEAYMWSGEGGRVAISPKPHGLNPA